MNELVSVIVPVYNVEKYVEKCLRSLEHQTYPAVEIIVVDDGSTDESGIRAERIAGECPSMRVIHQQNGGLSAARNTGIDNAKGEFLCFVDSDDWVEPDYVQKMVEAAKKCDADLVICGYIRENVDGKSLEDIKDADGTEWVVLSGVQAMKKLDNIFEPEYVKMVVAWNKLYRRKLFDQLRFPKILHEDEFIIHHILDSSRKVVLMPDVLYTYRERDNAITGRKNQYGWEHLQILDAMEDRILLCKAEKYADFFENIVLCFFESLIQLLLRYRKEDFVRLHLNGYFRKRALKVYLRYLLTLSNYYRKEYLGLICSPWKYRNKVKRYIGNKA